MKATIQMNLSYCYSSIPTITLSTMISTTTVMSNDSISKTPDMSLLSTDVCNDDTQIAVYSFLSLSLFISIVIINVLWILYLFLRRRSKKANFSEGST